MTKRIRVFGIVQGVGFRPTVSRHAVCAGVRGSVCNCGPYVEILAQGTQEQLETFLQLLRERPPVRASVIRIDVTDVYEARDYESFEIIESARTKGAIFISPDIAICDDCVREMKDPRDRRYQHPFINCTCCGPRLTILDALPYDRERTSMKAFPMCPACAAEYTDPATRRYDAQPVCCNDCGPEVYLPSPDRQHLLRGREAITHVRDVIAAGGIAAVKGIGGFHLCCDASSDAAVALLRQRKTRPMKPLAVMMRDLDTVNRECEVSKTAQEILTGHQKPILLLKKKSGGRLSPLIAPDNPKVGVMLPYAPVQLLLFDYDDGIEMPDMLVMTSGNVAGAPICRDDEEALRELGPLCDVILSHNREIRIRADDSVMDLYRDKPYMIRRSRGYAPLPYLLASLGPGSILAMGGELKNTFCVSRDDLFYPSSYIGDLADVRSIQALKETIVRYTGLLESEVSQIACDLHPGYQSTALAMKLAEAYGVEVVQIQHHFAHIASCLAENDVREKVIGISFDGTGYGEDGTIWGGELMVADLLGYERFGSIRPFLQIGGDTASREGWRIAVSMLTSIAGQQEGASHQQTAEGRQQLVRQCTALGLCSEQEANVLAVMHDKQINAVVSTSAGRLFDAVSALLGIRTCSTFEGEAATALEAAAWHFLEKTGTEPQPLPDITGDAAQLWPAFITLPTDQLVRSLRDRRLQGQDSEALAYAFHRELAAWIVAACCEISDRTGIHTTALSGGCFQNQLLLTLVHQALEEKGYRVLTHALLPPNDGGIALGQAAVAAARAADRAAGRQSAEK